MLPTYSAPTRLGSTPASWRAALTAAAARWRPPTSVSLLTGVWPTPTMKTSRTRLKPRPEPKVFPCAHDRKRVDGTPCVAHERQRTYDRARGIEETTLGRDTRVLLVGFGNMGQALVRGWLARGRDAATIRVVDTASAARAAAAALGITASERVGVSGGAPDVVLIAVKPNQLAPALVELAPLVGAP